MENPREPYVGEAVVYIDEMRRRLPALVQSVHGTSWTYGDRTVPPSINLVHISEDKDRTDTYGRQTEHVTSCSHFSQFADQVVGNCWYWPEETVTIREDLVQTQR